MALDPFVERMLAGLATDPFATTPGAAATGGAFTGPPAPTPADRKYNFGARAAKLLQGPWGSALKGVPGVVTLLQGLTGDDSTPVANAIRTGVGIGAIGNPVYGMPLATGMQAADLGMTALGAVAQSQEPSILAPDFASQVKNAGGTNAYVDTLGSGVFGGLPTLPQPALPTVPGLPATPKPAMVDTVPLPVERYQPRTAMGGAVQSLLGLKRITGDNKRAVANQKLLIDALKASSTSGKNNAEAARARLAVEFALRQFRADPTNLGAASGVLAGRAQGPRPVEGGVSFDQSRALVYDPSKNELTSQLARRTEAFAKDKSGVLYLTDGAGKAVRKATGAEQLRYEQAGNRSAR